MGTTSTLALPYPEPSDRVRNGSTAIRALAEAVDGALEVDGVVIGPADSPVSIPGSGSAVVSFPGTVDALDGFTWNGTVLTRVGPLRLFHVYAEVQLDSQVAGGATTLENGIEVLADGVPFAASYDKVSSASNDLNQLRKVHNVGVPVALGNGDTIQVRASGNALGGTTNVGSTALRVYSVGPNGTAS